MSLRWEPGPTLPVQADRDQLAQLLHNLLKNAEEAMPSGGQVTVRTRADGDRAVLEVEDTGPGIPAEDRERVLEPGVTTKGSGSGLGLALAARIAQGHGGALEVDSGATRWRADPPAHPPRGAGRRYSRTGVALSAARPSFT